jgi:hypothetical protein
LIRLRVARGRLPADVIIVPVHPITIVVVGNVLEKLIPFVLGVGAGQRATLSHAVVGGVEATVVADTCLSPGEAPKVLAGRFPLSTCTQPRVDDLAFALFAFLGLSANEAALPTVVAIGFVVYGDGVLAANAFNARVCGADDVIVAVEVSGTHASTSGTAIGDGTGVIVIARRGVELIDTAILRIAVIVGAEVLVIAVQGGATNTTAAIASV